MTPAPNSAKAKFLYATRCLRFVERFVTEDHTEIFKEFRKRRRFESESGELDAVAVHVENNSLFSGNDQPSKNSKLWSFSSEELDQRVSIVERARINNHWDEFSDPEGGNAR